MPFHSSFLPLLVLLFFMPAFLKAQSLAQISGLIRDGRDGQPIAAATVSLLGSRRDARSDSAGRFTISNLASGSYALEVSGPGYTAARAEFRLDGGESRNFDVNLVPNILGQTRSEVVASVSPFGSELGTNSSGDDYTLAGRDLVNLSSVLADDPMRAVQALPGVTSNNDFDAQFSVWGADYNRIGIYLDGVLLPNALHSLQGSNLPGSSSIFNPFLVDQLTLYKGAFSERFAESSGGAVEVQSREGDRDRFHLRAMANIALAGVEAEGPLGGNACSWIGGYRQSYIGALLGDRIPDPSLAFGIKDAQGRVTCHVTSKNAINGAFFDNMTTLDRSGTSRRLSPTQLLKADQRLLFANVGWLYTPSDKIVVSSHAAWIEDTFQTDNVARVRFGDGTHIENSAYSDASWIWASNTVLSGGGNVRQMRDTGFTEQIYTSPQLIQPTVYRGHQILGGGYLQQSWTGWAGRLHLMAGGRAEHSSFSDRTVFTPQASVAVRVLPSTQLQFGWGQYAQFPDLSIYAADQVGSRALEPLRATVSTVALTQHFGKDTQLRVEFFNRQDRDVWYQPYLRPRLIDGAVFTPPVYPAYTNSVRGFGRGIEFYFQHNITRGLSGWVSYAYSSTKQHESYTQTWFPSDFDQRHTINLYGLYTLRPSVTLSARWTYGSGFPLPGYLARQDNAFVLTPVLNGTRQAAYQRLDLRVNKTWNHEKYKIRLYVEALNVTDRSNYAFDNLNSFNTSTGRANVGISTLFPILPSAGIVFER